MESLYADLLKVGSALVQRVKSGSALVQRVGSGSALVQRVGSGSALLKSRLETLMIWFYGAENLIQALQGAHTRKTEVKL